MSLRGDLSALSIVEVIQLMHTIRKTGTLCVKGKRGEKRIVFADGYVLGAASQGGANMGDILAELGIVEKETPGTAGEKSLLVSLLEENKLDKDKAAKALEQLVLLTVVDLIGWRKGNFIFVEEEKEPPEEYRYLRDTLGRELVMDTQMVLMDSLRIFDERQRDGLIVVEEEGDDSEEIPLPEVPSAKPPAPAQDDPDMVISADALGLSDVENIALELPKTYEALEVFDLAKIHREKTKELLSAFLPEEQDVYLVFLDQFSASMTAEMSAARHAGDSHALIFFSRDELTQHSLMTLCKFEGIHVFTVRNGDEIDAKIEQCLSNGITPLVVYDSPDIQGEVLTKEEVSDIRQDRKIKFSNIPTVQLNSLPDYAFSLKAFDHGVRAVFPRPSKDIQKGNFINNTIRFLETFLVYLRDFFQEQDRQMLIESRLHLLAERSEALQTLASPKDLTGALLKFAAELFDRAISFVPKAELMGDLGIGIGTGKDRAPVSAAAIRVPLSTPSIFSEALSKGELFLGESSDPLLGSCIYSAIDRPRNQTVLLLPFKVRGKVISLIYADFGDRLPIPVPADLLRMFERQAGLVLEKTLSGK